MNDHVLASLLPLLACPECRGDLARQGGGLTCQSCSRSYEVADGIPLLAQAGSSELWGVESGQSDQHCLPGNFPGREYRGTVSAEV